MDLMNKHNLAISSKNNLITNLNTDIICITDGYINATKLCKNNGKEWKEYKRLTSTKEFINQLEGQCRIPTDLLIRTVTTGPNNLRGTFTHPLISIHLAQWISAETAVYVSDLVFRFNTGQITTQDSKKAAENLQKYLEQTNKLQNELSIIKRNFFIYFKYIKI